MTRFEYECPSCLVMHIITDRPMSNCPRCTGPLDDITEISKNGLGVIADVFGTKVKTAFLESLPQRVWDEIAAKRRATCGF